ncbi:hypothetical protein NH8B_0009 [Pseudogulbenkiania sp. NH8B]|nr:hypothetical protein NH8B_0009 [Pseudogulbenkiania sp. NH8B]
MAMPEAAMDEDHGLVFRENQIGLAGEVFDMQPVAESCCMKGFAENKLGLGVLAPDAGHHPAPGCLVYYVRHYARCCQDSGSMPDRRMKKG